MAHTHDTHPDSTGAGFISGMSLAIAAIVVALVVAAAVLLIAQPWDDDDDGGAVPNDVPGVEEPAGDDVVPNEPDVVPDGQ